MPLCQYYKDNDLAVIGMMIQIKIECNNVGSFI